MAMMFVKLTRWTGFNLTIVANPHNKFLLMYGTHPRFASDWKFPLHKVMLLKWIKPKIIIKAPLIISVPLFLRTACGWMYSIRTNKYDILGTSLQPRLPSHKPCKLFYSFLAKINKISSSYAFKINQ